LVEQEEFEKEKATIVDKMAAAKAAGAGLRATA
jgi:hypothetical protein